MRGGCGARRGCGRPPWHSPTVPWHGPMVPWQGLTGPLAGSDGTWPARRRTWQRATSRPRTLWARACTATPGAARRWSTTSWPRRSTCSPGTIRRAAGFKAGPGAHGPPATGSGAPACRDAGRGGGGLRSQTAVPVPQPAGLQQDGQRGPQGSLSCCPPKTKGTDMLCYHAGRQGLCQGQQEVDYGTTGDQRCARGRSL